MLLVAGWAVSGLCARAHAESWRCNGHLIDAGDPAIDVRQACGEPSYIDPWVGGASLEIGPAGAMEAWTYNRGPRQLLHIVVFDNAQVVDVQTAGYGFTPGQAGDCAGADIPPGVSKYQLLAACGEPDQRSARFFYSSRLDTGARTYYLGRGVFPTYQEIWIYNFGPNRLERKITLQNGRVVDVEALGRGFSR